MPIVALTATATAAVQADIARSLRLPHAMRIVASFNRPELQYDARLAFLGFFQTCCAGTT